MRRTILVTIPSGAMGSLVIVSRPIHCRRNADTTAWCVLSPPMRCNIFCIILDSKLGPDHPRYNPNWKKNLVTSASALVGILPLGKMVSSDEEVPDSTVAPSEGPCHINV